VNTTPRTITIRTDDHGPVTVTCPTWCTAQHEQGGYRADILHAGPDVALVFCGHDIGDASLAESPYAELPGGGLGVSVSLLGQTLNPVQLYDFAATLDTYADRLRDLADQLHTLISSEGDGQ
jgi:hypothetical protein